MARLPIDKLQLSRIAGRSVVRYIDLVYRTSRIIREPADHRALIAAHSPAIIAVWHGQFLMAPQAKPLEVPLAIMLARHGDAELFAEALTRFNTTLIRGAGANGRRKDRGGASALRNAMRTLQEGVSVGMTADVPPGPARKAGIGIITLAALSGRPIIPLAAASSRSCVLGTWSRMTINLPFGTLACVFGDPIHVGRDADADAMEAARQAVEAGLDRATARAYQLVGADIWRTLPPEAVARITERGEPLPAPPGLGLKGYRTLTRLLRPAVPLLLGARARRGKEEPGRRRERLGFAAKPRPEGVLAWIHAASVGEINAVLPLADELRAARPGVRFLFTSGTVTSARVAADRLHPDDIHQYVPLDSPRFIARFLDHWRPDTAILTESELWPNMILECARKGVPLVLVNARMSSRSFDRWRRLEGIIRPLLSRLDLVLAQNAELAERFRALGARRVEVVGNIKIDAPPPPVDEGELQRLRQALGQRPFYVAASTHDGEERILAAAHRLIAQHHAGFCTIIAPRHPDRGAAIAQAMKAAGLGTAQRSLGELPSAATDVYIADTIGELGTLFVASSVTFVGGSLVPRGGHNPIEAIRLGAAIVSGPHWFNFADSYETLRACGGVVTTTDAETLAEAVSRLLADPAEMQALRAGAETALARLSGALSRSVEAILPLVPTSKELVGAG